MFLEIAGSRVRASFEAGRSDGERISSVQYLRFAVGAGRAEALQRGPARVIIEHPNYQHIAELSEETRKSLAEDLR